MFACPAWTPYRIIPWHRSDSPLLGRPSVIVAQMTHAEIRLGNGDVYTVEGTLNEVERSLSDAARSGHARLAWFKERGTAESIGINPAHVAALRGGETSD